MSITSTALPVGTWTVDTAHSSVEFQVKHMGIATVKGFFSEFEGTLEVGEDLSQAKAHGTVQTASVDTREPKRDEHLRSADFFEVERFPQITFRSTAITPLDEDTFQIEGDLSIHGVTQPVKLEAVVQGADQDPWGNERVALEIAGQIKRSDFDMRFNQALGSGNMLVGDKVKIAVEISAIKA